MKQIAIALLMSLGLLLSSLLPVSVLAGELDVIPGDVDGSGIVDLRDVSAIFHICTGELAASEPMLRAADTDESGTVTMRDAAAVYAFAAGLSSSPVPGESGGNEPAEPDTPDPPEVTIVKEEIIHDPDSSEHGVRVVTWSDGTQEEIPF